ncbi:MAG TPA: hypothetical protein PKA28_15975 [Methylomusa anaerophila]|uniref:Uncharacterized protein n=1 Tax=Methylomusa anaerophila TaxID=1930071 RepID=A0A348AK69_9FIRM|nr:hypothetical protein [Methylomusa anaerophila]BBB91467.1 hypothetical protein MAMMFC1_02151 [Methylomusa anaerophila]HML89943.1 hypothetical protein [Methylomusa anaerophila]
MKTTDKKAGFSLQALPLFLFFGFHVVIGVAAAIAGVFVIANQGILYAGLGLIGAAIFALTNAVEGFIELFMGQGTG